MTEPPSELSTLPVRLAALADETAAALASGNTGSPARTAAVRVLHEFLVKATRAATVVAENAPRATLVAADPDGSSLWRGADGLGGQTDA